MEEEKDNLEEFLMKLELETKTKTTDVVDGKKELENFNEKSKAKIGFLECDIETKSEQINTIQKVVKNLKVAIYSLFNLLDYEITEEDREVWGEQLNESNIT